MQITQILQIANNNKYNLNGSESSLSTEKKVDDLPGTKASEKLIRKTLDFRQIQYEDSFVAIPFSKRELNDYLKREYIEIEKQKTFTDLFDEIIQTAEAGNIQKKDDLIEKYFACLDKTLSEEARKRIKYSIEQTVGAILIEGVQSQSNNSN
jgi:hypothetical protein